MADVDPSPAPSGQRPGLEIVGAPPICRFNAKVRALREVWSQTDIAPGYAWRRATQNERSGSRRFNVIDDKSGQQGKAKPGEVGLSDVARAAHEKIVSDLAALPGIDLPVPPVTLFNRGETAKGDRLNEKGEKVDSPQHIAISAWAFDSCDPLNIKFAHLSAVQKNSLIAPFSAMWIFEAWVSAANAHMGHVMLDNATSDAPGVAWIDHAFSLSYQWERNKEPPLVGWYLQGLEADKAVQKEMAEKIEGITDDQIREVVGRIKPDWLSETRQYLIISKLIKRRAAIRSLCGMQ